MLLLCPECCQWREPAEGRCSTCGGSLDLAIPDPSLESIADEIGELSEWIGKGDLLRTVLPKRGNLYSTTNGLLFVPDESRVILFADARQAAAAQRGLGRLMTRVWSRLTRRGEIERFVCEQRASGLSVSDRLALAGLLCGDPGVWFLTRAMIASWQRPRGQWEFVRADARSWPERISMLDRDGDRALQTWLETTECPLPVNVR